MTESPSPADEDSLEAIAERFLEDLQAGRRPDRSAICRAHPSLGEALDRRIALLEVLHRAAREETERSGALPGGAGRTGTEETTGGGEVGEGRPDLERTGRFRVLGLLGQGSFGEVYQVRDEELGRIVAMKVPRAGRFGTDEEKERFLREARSAALLKHPGIVQVYEITRELGVPCILSEYIEGRTLAEALRSGKPERLLDLDPTQAGELLVAGRVPLQVLAGACDRGPPMRGQVLYDDAPYGVGYLVALLTAP